MDGKADDPDVTIIFLGTQDPPAVDRPRSGFFVWPGGRAGFVLDDEIHFVLGKYVYIIPRDPAARTNLEPAREARSAKGYTDARDLVYLLENSISAEALILGDELSMSEYKAKYIQKLWMPTIQEYREWIGATRPKLVNHVFGNQLMSDDRK